MESLGDILRTTGHLLTPQGERPSEESLEALWDHHQEVVHRANCPHCSGDSVKALCTNDPEYPLKIRHKAAGVPYPPRMTFDAFHRLPGTEAALEEAKHIAENPLGWLTMVGEYGTGKSHLAMAAVYERLRVKEFGWFITSGGLLDRWRSWFDRDQEEINFAERFERDCDASYLVVVDDLGSERGTEWATERLTMFLDHRYGRELPTIITTNYNQEVLSRRSGGRIADRVFDRRTGRVQVVFLDCGSYRTGT